MNLSLSRSLTRRVRSSEGLAVHQVKRGFCLLSAGAVPERPEALGVEPIVLDQDDLVAVDLGALVPRRSGPPRARTAPGRRQGGGRRTEKYRPGERDRKLIGLAWRNRPADDQRLHGRHAINPVPVQDQRRRKAVVQDQVGLLALAETQGLALGAKRPIRRTGPRSKRDGSGRRSKWRRGGIGESRVRGVGSRAAAASPARPRGGPKAGQQMPASERSRMTRHRRCGPFFPGSVQQSPAGQAAIFLLRTGIVML